MQLFEFDDRPVDINDIAQQELRRMSAQRQATQEDQDDNAVYVGTFLQSVYPGIKQSQLVVGDTYYPVDVSFDTTGCSVVAVISQFPVSYKTTAGSRLIFITETNKEVQFPADGFIPDNSRRFLYTTSSEITAFAGTLVMKFKDVERWNYQVLSYDTNGSIRRVNV